MTKINFTPSIHSLNAVKICPLFSIITATYNSGELFDRTAKSIIAQNFRDFEWIVIDGKSEDDTVSRIKAHRRHIKHWVSEKDSGISEAWNKGISLSQGEYVLFLNAGDTYDSDFLYQVQAHIGDDRRVICSHARLLNEVGEHIGSILSEPYKLYRAMHLAHNWCAVPRIHYEQLGGYAEMRLAMDFEWFHRYYQHYGSDGFVVIEKTLGDYHLGGVSDVNFKASFQANCDVLVRNGTPAILANFWRLVYTTKHAWRMRQSKTGMS